MPDRLGLHAFHYSAFLLVTIDLPLLTLVWIALEALSGRREGSGKRLAGAMVLFLLGIFFVRFESAHDIKAWSGAAALHPAGIPLQLFVLRMESSRLLLSGFRFTRKPGWNSYSSHTPLASPSKLGFCSRALVFC